MVIFVTKNSNASKLITELYFIVTGNQQAYQLTSPNRIDIILLGDFNQHDELWGGDNVSPARKGEAEPLIFMINDLGFRSLLP